MKFRTDLSSHHLFHVDSSLLSKFNSLDYNIINQQLSTTDYISVYGAFGLLQSITFVAGIMTMNRRTLSASLHLHQSIFLTSSICWIEISWSIPSLVLGSVRKSINCLSASKLWYLSSLPNVCSSLFWFSIDVAGNRVALRLMKYRNRMTRQNIHQNVVRNRVEMDWNWYSKYSSDYKNN